MSISAGPSGSAGEPVYHPCPPKPSCGYCNGTVDGASRLDWSFLDAVYCISLKTREDRRAEAAAEFHKRGLCRRVIFHCPDKHPKSGRIGSWEAHRAVAMHALAHDCRRVLICEDDVLFTRRVGPATLASIERALGALPDDWMIFFLGHWPLAAYFVRPNVLRTSSACCHAYIASPRLLTPGALPGSRSARSPAGGSIRPTRDCRRPMRCPDARDPAGQPERSLRQALAAAQKEAQAPASDHPLPLP